MTANRTACVALALLLHPLAAAAADSESCKCPSPKVYFLLGEGRAGGVPWWQWCGKTGGGVVTVRQPSPDVLEITMTGAASTEGVCSTSSGVQVVLDQLFTVVTDDPKVLAAVLQIQGYAAGLVHTPGKESAVGFSRACAAVHCDPAGPGGAGPVASFCLPDFAAGAAEARTVYARGTPVLVPVRPGCYTLSQTFLVSSAKPKWSCGRGGAIVFAPGQMSALEFTDHKNPFRGISREEFGFHVRLKLVPLEPGAAADKKSTDKKSDGKKSSS
jgi:hypothetical protein